MCKNAHLYYINSILYIFIPFLSGGKGRDSSAALTGVGAGGAFVLTRSALLSTLLPPVVAVEVVLLAAVSASSLSVLVAYNNALSMAEISSSACNRPAPKGPPPLEE